MVGRLSAILNIPPPAEPMPACLRKVSGTDRERFRMHKVNAKKRGIPFHFTFEEWVDWWQASGHYHERGTKRGQYVMARNGDVGPYAPANVTCQQAQVNSSAAHIGKMRSPETRARMSKSLIGHGASPEARKNMSAAAKAAWALRRER